jgi:hypothetical protein
MVPRPAPQARAGAGSGWESKRRTGDGRAGASFHIRCWRRRECRQLWSAVVGAVGRIQRSTRACATRVTDPVLELDSPSENLSVRSARRCGSWAIAQKVWAHAQPSVWSNCLTPSRVERSPVRTARSPAGPLLPRGPAGWVCSARPSPQVSAPEPLRGGFGIHETIPRHATEEKWSRARD